MEKSIFDYKRKSYISIGEIFFWTSAVGYSFFGRIPTKAKNE